MANLDGLPCRDRDGGAGVDYLPGTVPVELHAELCRIGEDVVAAAVGDVHVDVAEPGHMERHVECLDERWDAVEGDALAATVATGRRDADQARRGFQHNLGLRLDHRDHAGLQQRGDHADRVRTAHGVGAVGLTDDEPGVRLGIYRREHKIGTGLWSTTRLEAQELADRIVDFVDVPQLVAHGRPGYVEHRPQIAGALLTLGMYLDSRERLRRAHGESVLGEGGGQRLIEHGQELGGGVVREAEQRSAPRTEVDPLMRKPELAFRVVRAALHVLDPRKDLAELPASLVEMTRAGRVHDQHVMPGQDVGRAGKPAAHPPAEIVRRLIVAAAHDLEATTVTSLQMQEPGEVPTRFFDGDDVGMICNFVEALEPDLDAGAGRIVVEHYRLVDGVG